ncbi:MAG: dienelactone hydrolase, partial [Candidatus Paceibacteria bacterium]
QKRVRTYLSSVDNSAQEYAIVPPSKSDGGGKPEWMGLVLSLHGAGVTSWGQANCYGQRTDFWVVAAMNRRKFGFDWQDWGRRDAYDVLALALRESEVDPRFTYVTGHSMGGHGTWHLAANDLDGFAACAPSAGWESFDSYTGRPEGSLAEVWHAADGSSRTLNLIGNLKQLPTFILHGTNDDNVPATEALSMLEALTKAGGTVEAHFEGGAGHWWGNRCVDWPPFFDFFRKHSIPEDPTHVDFTTVDPSVDADHHWLRVEQPSTYGELLRIHGEWKQEDDSVSLETENVALFRVERTLERAVIDGQSFDLDPESQAHWFRRAADTWSLSESGPSPEEKQAQRSGPLKNAFDKKFLMVVGTGGSAEENAAMLAAAQLHAGSWRYRANGCAKIMTDVDYNFLVAESFAGLQSNVIAYGNHDINLAFRWLRDDCPIDVRRGRVELTRDGESHKVEGEGLGCAFLYPHGASDQHLVGIFAFTGISGARLSSNLQPFKSGAGYPDFTLFNAEILSSGDGGVLETGWFDRDWRLPPAK